MVRLLVVVLSVFQYSIAPIYKPPTKSFLSVLSERLVEVIPLLSLSYIEGTDLRCGFNLMSNWMWGSLVTMLDTIQSHIKRKILNEVKANLEYEHEAYFHKHQMGH